MFAAFVLEHRLLHELLNVSTAEQRQLADDLPDGTGARQTHQSLTGQSSDLICICNGHLHRQQGQKHLQERFRIQIKNGDRTKATFEKHLKGSQMSEVTQ